MQSARRPTVSKHRVQKRAKEVNQAGRPFQRTRRMPCTRCGATESSRWRYIRNKEVCNACGLKSARRRKRRREERQGLRKKKEPKKKKKRKTKRIVTSKELNGAICPLCYNVIKGYTRKGPRELGRVCWNCGNFYSRIKKLGQLCSIEEMRIKRMY